MGVFSDGEVVRYAGAGVLPCAGLKVVEQGGVNDLAVALVSGGTPALDASLGTYYTLAILTNIAVTVAIPSNPPVTGSREIVVAIRNQTGGVLTNTPTFNGGAKGFKFSAATNPANGTQIIYTFRWDPVQSFWYEVGSHLAAGL